MDEGLCLQPRGLCFDDAQAQLFSKYLKKKKKNKIELAVRNRNRNLVDKGRFRTETGPKPEPCACLLMAHDSGVTSRCQPDFEGEEHDPHPPRRGLQQ